jgi:hypothetical protein
MDNCPKCKSRDAFNQAELIFLALQLAEKDKREEKEANESNLKKQEKPA